MDEEKETYDLDETLEELGMNLTQFQKVPADLLETILVRVYPQKKEPGKLPEDSPDNEIYYSGESVRKLKAELAKRRKKDEPKNK